MAQAAPYPGPTGKVRALTPLAVDWFRGVPSPYPPLSLCPPSFSALLPPLLCAFARPIVSLLPPTSPPLSLPFA